MLEKILGNKIDNNEVKLSKHEVKNNDYLCENIRELKREDLNNRFIEARRTSNNSYFYGLISSQSYTITYTLDEDRTNIQEKEVTVSNIFGIPYKKR